MRGYILSVPAQEDLAGILDYYFEEAGYRVSRKMAARFVYGFSKNCEESWNWAPM
jgi:plasmid stabilization system protein ParE